MARKTRAKNYTEHANGPMYNGDIDIHYYGLEKIGLRLRHKLWFSIVAATLFVGSFFGINALIWHWRESDAPKTAYQSGAFFYYAHTALIIAIITVMGAAAWWKVITIPITPKNTEAPTKKN